jgi:hypothetical protein
MILSFFLHHSCELILYVCSSLSCGEKNSDNGCRKSGAEMEFVHPKFRMLPDSHRRRRHDRLNSRTQGILTERQEKS